MLFLILWAFRLRVERLASWSVPAAILGAVIGATLLAREPVRPGAMLGGFLGAVVGTAFGYGGRWVWERLDGPGRTSGPPP
jgi:hypothetical protein